MTDDVTPLVLSRLHDNPEYMEAYRQEALRKAKRKASKKAFKEARGRHNLALWKKYFGIDAEKLNAKVEARKKAKARREETLRNEANAIDITLTIKFK